MRERKKTGTGFTVLVCFGDEGGTVAGDSDGYLLNWSFDKLGMTDF
jgi:hypothetical protein